MSDPDYEWDEVMTLSGAVRLVRGRCLHRDVVPVDTVSGQHVADLCLICDVQLPVGVAAR